MIALTSAQDKIQLKEHALELLNEDNFEGLIILVDVLKDTDFKIKDKEVCLKWAAQNGHLSIVKNLVEHGANIHVTNNHALRWASENGHLDVVKYLVEKGANVRTVDDFPVKIAAIKGRLDILKYLVESGAYINNYALRRSAENGHLEVVKYLVESGANVRSAQEDALAGAKFFRHIDIVSYLESVLNNDSSHQ